MSKRHVTDSARVVNNNFQEFQDRLLSLEERRDLRLRLLKDDPHCRYCRGRVHRRNATLDHIIPVSKGGEHTEANLVLCCATCNSRKSDSTVLEILEWASQVATAARQAAGEVCYG